MLYPQLFNYLCQGWKFIYDPDTHVIGISHAQGGQQSLCEIAQRKTLRDQFGHELARLIHNALVPADATHVRIDGQALFYYRVSQPSPTSGMNLKVMSRWEDGEWKVQTGGPLPWDELILLVPETRDRGLMCHCHSVLVHPKGVVVINIPAGECTDMSGAIRVAEAVESDVRRIEVMAGGKLDIVYHRPRNGEWVAHRA